jgi:hypothetical protein
VAYPNSCCLQLLNLGDCFINYMLSFDQSTSRGPGKIGE